MSFSPLLRTKTGYINGGVNVGEAQVSASNKTGFYSLADEAGQH